MPTRRQFLGCVAAGSLYARFGFSASKPLRGIFIILATPYADNKAIDYEDLATEVDFMDRCGVQGMVWPQMASEYMRLTREERFHGMEVLAKAAKGKRPALVLGVQGANIEAALEFARRAEALEPDALIAIPPTEAHSLNDFQEYYRALGRIAKRPFFIQTTGGAKGIVPDVSLLTELAQEFPNFGYVKEEYAPVYGYITPDSPELWRRSIYRFAVRSTPQPFMTTLDCPNPANLSPARPRPSWQGALSAVRLRRRLAAESRVRRPH